MKLLSCISGSKIKALFKNLDHCHLNPEKEKGAGTI